MFANKPEGIKQKKPKAVKLTPKSKTLRNPTNELNPKPKMKVTIVHDL